MFIKDDRPLADVADAPERPSLSQRAWQENQKSSHGIRWDYATRDGRQAGDVPAAGHGCSGAGLR